MPLDRVVVSSEDIEHVRPMQDAAGSPPSLSPALTHPLPSPVPWWARLCLSPLVLALPLLCAVAVILRVAFRNQPPRVKYAWVSFLSTLLVIGGIFSTAAAVLFFSLAPLPSLLGAGLPELDQRTQFPALPTVAALTSAQASQQLKPLVIVVSPATRLWNRQEIASNHLGAGVLLHADKDGYLFATANHVAGSSGDALVATESGVWSKAEVVGQAPGLDLALLWAPRHSDAAAAPEDFVQPIAPPRDGAPIFVIGHPEGLRYTLSTGIVSGLRDGAVQISAPVSPGNSGGPVYDDHGALIAIVSAKFDRNRDANAENLGFATLAGGFLDDSGWTFRPGGRQKLDRYVKAAAKIVTVAGKD